MSNREQRIAIMILFGLFACCFSTPAVQDYLPSPPADRSFIYYLNERNDLVALPFETGRSSLKLDGPARETKIGFIELSGEHAVTVFENDRPRIFVFASPRTGSHPPFLVSLTQRRGARRATAIAQRGLNGYAIESNQIIKPDVRVIAPAGEQVFMEIRPRISLMPGEYAIIGDDLARIATFRIVAAKAVSN